MDENRFILWIYMTILDIVTQLKHRIPMNRRISLLTSSLIFVPLLSAQEKPNVVIILADDMGYGDVSCNHPHGRIHTPAIDHLAEDGLRFTDAHSAGALSGPSRYGLVTGCYQFRAPAPKNNYWGYLGPCMNDGRITIGGMMQQAGYTTACIGKWHLGLDWQLEDPDKPQILTPQRFGDTNVDFSAKAEKGPGDFGFDYSFILPASLDMPPYVFVKNGQVVDPDVILTADAYPHRLAETDFAWDRRYTGEEDIYWERGVWWRNGEMSRSFRFEDCLQTIVAEGIDFIERESHKDEPFFLYLPLTGPHTPWMASEGNKGTTALGTYSDFIKDIDQTVEKVRAKLEELGIDQNTLVIFASDNGAAWAEDDIQQYAHNSNWNRRGQKGDAYDGGHHVPLIIYWPGHTEAGSIYEQTVGLVDLYATLAEMTGQQLGRDQAEDSFSLLSVLNGNLEKPCRDHIIYLSGSNKLALKKGDWKYIDCLGSGGFTKPYVLEPVKNGPKGQLYNLKEDPMETTNLYLEKEHKAREMRNELMKLKEQGRSRP